MAAQRFREHFGPAEPVPLEKLVPIEKVRSAIAAPGSMHETETRVVNGKMQRVYKNLPDSNRDLHVMASQTFAHRPYVVYDLTERYTYGDIFQQSLTVAHWLKHQFNVRKGDRVGIAARNYPEFVSTYWGIHLLGAVAVPINSFAEGDVLAFCIRDVSCRVVVVDVERLAKLQDFVASLFDHEVEDAFNQNRTRPLDGIVVLPREGARRVGEKQKHWLTGEAHKTGRLFDFEELQKSHRDAALKGGVPKVQIAPEDNATILFTSGTTGMPKGVLSTQRQALSSLFLAGFGTAFAFGRRGKVPPGPAEDKDQGSMLLMVPLMHTTGIHSGLTASTAVGSRLNILSAYSVDAVGKCIEKERVSVVLGIGFMIREIINSKYDVSSLAIFSHGGSSAAKELPTEMQAKNANSVMGSGYGLTEVNGVAAGIACDDYFHRPTSCGQPPAAVDLMVVDPDTCVKKAQGEVGELWIKSPGTAKGYWNRPEATAEAFLPDGWFRSGDLAKMDEEGFVYIVDRAKDIIVRGGENISCAQVENAVYTHPEILDCAVVSIPEKRMGERVAAVCVLRDPSRELPSEASIIEAARKVLPKHAVPEYVWVRKEPLERNPSGKVLKPVVRQAVRQRAQEQGWSPPDPSQARASKM